MAPVAFNIGQALVSMGLLEGIHIPTFDKFTYCC